MVAVVVVVVVAVDILGDDAEDDADVDDSDVDDADDDDADADDDDDDDDDDGGSCLPPPRAGPWALQSSPTATVSHGPFLQIRMPICARCIARASHCVSQRGAGAASLLFRVPSHAVGTPSRAGIVPHIVASSSAVTV